MTRELERAYLPERFRQPRPPTTKSTQRDVAVLVVAYRNPHLLRDCLASVEQHLGEVDVLVWDNSGPLFPGMDEVIAAYSHVRWYLGSANLGFAAAVNALAREVPKHDLLLLNPDATLQGALSGTFAALRKPGVAAAAPLVTDNNSGPRPVSRMGRRAPRAEPCPSPGVHRRLCVPDQGTPMVGALSDAADRRRRIPHRSVPGDQS